MDRPREPSTIMNHPHSPQHGQSPAPDAREHLPRASTHLQAPIHPEVRCRKARSEDGAERHRATCGKDGKTLKGTVSG
jgi:hypothetical protein|eukprot:COSAG02_NODE_127_length_34879_cov_12.705060_28_plen_78_part_00